MLTTFLQRESPLCISMSFDQFFWNLAGHFLIAMGRFKTRDRSATGNKTGKNWKKSFFCFYIWCTNTFGWHVNCHSVVGLSFFWEILIEWNLCDVEKMLLYCEMSFNSNSPVINFFAIFSEMVGDTKNFTKNIWLNFYDTHFLIFELLTKKNNFI